MAWTFAILSLGLSTVALGIIIALGKKLSGGASSETVTLLVQESKTYEDRLQELSAIGGNYASSAQLEGVSAQAEELVTSLESQKRLLKEIEARLEQAQRDVEGKEASQQDMKSSKEEDEGRLQQLLSQYDEVSTQSVSLEQELAASLKELDALVVDVPMTPDQRTVFQELLNALTAAGSRLRDLITDYQAVQERLESLKLQHNDLEDEYTRLVEQQLGV